MNIPQLRRRDNDGDDSITLRAKNRVCAMLRGVREVLLLPLCEAITTWLYENLLQVRAVRAIAILDTISRVSTTPPAAQTTLKIIGQALGTSTQFLITNSSIPSGHIDLKPHK
jgi:hypothetical protein